MGIKLKKGIQLKVSESGTQVTSDAECSTGEIEGGE